MLPWTKSKIERDIKTNFDNVSKLRDLNTQIPNLLEHQVIEKLGQIDPMLEIKSKLAMEQVHSNMEESCFPPCSNKGLEHHQWGQCVNECLKVDQTNAFRTTIGTKLIDIKNSLQELREQYPELYDQVKQSYSQRSAAGGARKRTNKKSKKRTTNKRSMKRKTSRRTKKRASTKRSKKRTIKRRH